eukprot:SAG31_NODE_15232_length_764_cov_1.147368_2_plen_198_part_01
MCSRMEPVVLVRILFESAKCSRCESDPDETPAFVFLLDGWHAGTRTANAAMQSMHGVPFPVYRGFELLAAAGSHRIPVIINRRAPNLTATDGAVALMATVGNLDESSSMLGSGEAAVLRVFLSNFVPDAKGSSPCIDKPQPCPAHPHHTFCATNYSADQCEHAPAPCPPCPPSPPLSADGVAPHMDLQLKSVGSTSGS